MPRNAHGFTLIELILVMVLVGVLAAIAIPKFMKTRERAYLSSMKSDLRNLATAQEVYFSDNNNFTFTSALSALEFTPSKGVSLAIGNVSSSGWSATSTHSATSKTCSIYYGGTPQVPPASQPGVVACTP